MSSVFSPIALLFAGVTLTTTSTTDEARFMAENDLAMNRMVAAMQVKPSGDIERDFVRMMVPHHQGAIDMARAQLRYGHNEQLRHIAQEIIATQQQEIEAMWLAIGEPLPPSDPSLERPSMSPSDPTSVALQPPRESMER